MHVHVCKCLWDSKSIWNLLAINIIGISSLVGGCAWCVQAVLFVCTFGVCVCLQVCVTVIKSIWILLQSIGGNSSLVGGLAWCVQVTADEVCSAGGRSARNSREFSWRKSVTWAHPACSQITCDGLHWDHFFIRMHRYDAWKISCVSKGLNEKFLKMKYPASGKQLRKVQHWMDGEFSFCVFWIYYCSI